MHGNVGSFVFPSLSFIFSFFESYLKFYQYRTYCPFFPVNLKYCVCILLRVHWPKDRKRRAVFPRQHPLPRISTQDPSGHTASWKQTRRPCPPWKKSCKEIGNGRCMASKVQNTMYHSPRFQPLSLLWLKDSPISSCHLNDTLHRPECLVTILSM